MLEAYRKNQSLDKLAALIPTDAADAIVRLTASLEDEPSNSRALMLLAQCYVLRDELQDARHTLETVLDHDSDAAVAKGELAKIHNKIGNFDAALKLLEEVTNTRPEITENWQLLGETLQQLGQIDASDAALKQYKMITAFNAKLHAAEVAFAKADFQAADGMCRQLLKLVPDEFRSLRLLAKIARQFHHYEFSTATLARCVETRPADVGLGLDYAYSLLGSRKYQHALQQCQRIIEIAPERVEVYDLKAELLYFLGRFDESIEIYRGLLEVPERRTQRLLALGKVLKTVGSAADAQDCFKQAIGADPASGQAYWELANLKTYRFSDGEIDSMNGLLDAGDLSALNKVLIQFALGKALEDAADYADSFKHYQAANREYAKLRPAGYKNQNAQFKTVFTAEYFNDRKDSGSKTDAAIFVVGLPRSGSTLVEQILSSHSLVDATQELDEVVSIARDLNNPNQPGRGQYPLCLENLSAEQSKSLAQRYLDYAQQYRQQAPRFVDKAPHNFHHIGLIKSLLPNARIIDIRRDPMASGWSVYKQFFAESFLFSYDLDTIGKYYNDYIELMNHWHSVLPNKILTLRYEDLVSDLPGSITAMLQYCGLEFEEACLNFHLNDRAVATPSSEQVRQPLYSDALQQWKHYEAFLEPLRTAIERGDAAAINE